MGCYHEALKDSELALKFDSENGFAYRNYAKVLLGLGRIDEARNILKFGLSKTTLIDSDDEKEGQK